MRQVKSVWWAAASLPNCTCTHTAGYSASRRPFAPSSPAGTTCSTSPGASKSREPHRDYRELFEDPEIEVVDICTPPALHAQMIVTCMRAGKHVICEKPFTGYFGRPDDPAPIGTHVPKSVMYERVLAEMHETREAIRASGKLFLYAEDWIHAAIAKTRGDTESNQKQGPPS